MKPQFHSRKSPLILVVDDEITLRMLARAALEQNGFEVVEAHDGPSALRSFERDRPDLVLLDVQLPGMDGFTTCREMLRLDEEIPVVIVTGSDELDCIRSAYDAGAMDFVAKPVQWLVLARRCSFILRAADTMAKLREAHARVRSAERLARLGVWQLDLVRREIHCSEEMLRIFGMSAWRGPVPLAMLLDRIDREDQQRVGQAATRTFTEAGSYQEDFRIVLPGGSRRIIRTHGEPIFDDEGRPIWMWGTSQDITERFVAEEQIRFLVNRDSLTGLANRRLLGEALERATARSGELETMGALLSIGLQGFKRVNETLGHAAGDRLLQEAAERLVNAIRMTDVVGRTGDPEWAPTVARATGGEFATILPAIREAGDAATVARRVVDRLSRPFQVEGHEVSLGSAVGIAVWPHDGREAQTILRSASTAMDHAEAAGANQYRFFRQEMNAAVMQRFTLELELRKALERGEFRLFYQPKVQLGSRRITSVEALIRWQHPDGSLILPGEFIPLAEETGLIVPMGEWVLREVCRQQRAWSQQGLRAVPVSANLSARQLRERDLVDLLVRILEEERMDPSQLELEITESAILEDVHTAIRKLSRIRERGVTLALDDFGTGYSSLSYLKSLPVDTLKIDRSFVRDVAVDASSAALTEIIVSMGRILRLGVVAEGVETEEQARFLRVRDCEEAQGFLFSRPLDPDTLAQLLREDRPLP